MNEEIFEKAEKLFRKGEKIAKFSTKFGYPYQECARLMKETITLADAISEIKNPQSKDELMQAELKRRLNTEGMMMDCHLNGKIYDFDTIIALYGIPHSDIAELRGWLENNRLKTLDSVDRLFQSSDVKNYELGLNADIPNIRRQVEEFGAVQIQKYHKKLGRLLQDLSKAGEYLRDITAVPTINERSYFNSLTTTLAISIPAIVYSTEDGGLHLRERELIRLYGHEGMGHALNHVMTKSGKLPYFLTVSSPLNESTMESVSQFYQNILFEDLKNSPETQKELSIRHIFDDIYQEAKDIRLLDSYNQKLFYYGISLLADKSLGEPNDPNVLKRKIDLLNEVTLDPIFPRRFIEQNRYNFDLGGNLGSQLLSELRYAAQPVQRALAEFTSQGINYESNRDKIDETLLKGFWSPIGFVDNARIAARGR